MLKLKTVPFSLKCTYRNKKKVVDKILNNDKNIIIENWIEPPEITQYRNAEFEKMDNDVLICNFKFPEKYSDNPFFVKGRRIFEPGQLYRGRRHFYPNRHYSLLEYYAKDNSLTAYYIDIVLPAKILLNKIYIVDLRIDFLVSSDKQRYLILDEDEFEEAVRMKFYTPEEIEACIRTSEWIKSRLDAKDFDSIFKDYEISTYVEWERYQFFED